eukprot:8598229-Alexandrium_andersonii.AAC.1
MSASLVGSEMCIRDRLCARPATAYWCIMGLGLGLKSFIDVQAAGCMRRGCLLYTSDAADDM